MNASFEQCKVCGAKVASYDGLYVPLEKLSKFHCNRCFNQSISEMYDLDFAHPDFQPITLTDCDGVPHEFTFTTRVTGIGIVIEALEIKKGQLEGYRFQVIGSLESDTLDLFNQLIDRIKRALSRKHIEMGAYGLEITDDNMVRGTIDCDDEFDMRVPLLIIDGKLVTWEEFGRMLMEYEGWDFKLEIFDKSEER